MKTGIECTEMFSYEGLEYSFTQQLRIL